MAKFKCVCGHQPSTSGTIPNPSEWHCLSDADFDAFEGLVHAEDVYTQSTIMYRCPTSEHLWCFWNGIDEPPAIRANGLAGGLVVGRQTGFGIVVSGAAEVRCPTPPSITEASDATPR